MDCRHKELVTRFLADTCEICGMSVSTGDVTVHHIRTLTALAPAVRPPSGWAHVVLDRRRETVVACDACHDRIHEAQAARSITP
ncbi:hypothetical protein [Streptomyces sp. NPDC012510]|uniref:HNH endonuclease n=1 Tax=Streptomyces sp. NPDC012510 TaxID=3364838 RepID=UPI0036EE9B34